MRPDWSKVFDQFIRSYWGCGEDIESDRRNEPKALDSKLVHNELLSVFVSDVSSFGHRHATVSCERDEVSVVKAWQGKNGVSSRCGELRRGVWPSDIFVRCRMMSAVGQKRTSRSAN